MTFLAFAPVAFLLIRDGAPLVALLGWLGIQAVEPLPDWDIRVPGLSHRGTSHSVLAALVVGGVLGASGWLLGGFAIDLIQLGVAVLPAVFDLGGYVPALSDGITLIAASIKTHAHALAGGTIDRYEVALFGFAIGVYGILVHLLGDIITTAGIQPFLPVSRWRISLSPLRAESPTANAGLFMLGSLALLAAVVWGFS